MSRSVKCAITKEYGTNDTFIKIEGKYYKSQEIYDQDKHKRQSRLDLVDFICLKFLDYYNGQPFPQILTRKLKELEFYSNDVILETCKQKENDIQYAISTKHFTSEVQKVSYIFAIIKNNIADVNKQFQRYNKQERQNNQSELLEIETMTGTTLAPKNISHFLDGDDI
jgi:hypothetical protein